MIETTIQAAPAGNPDDDDVLIDGQELAQWLGLSPRTIEIWRWRGGGPKFTKVGRYVRYKKGVVRQWIANHEYENTTQYGK